MEPKVIFEDDNILVVDKPSGITVNRSETTRSEKTVQEWIEERLTPGLTARAEVAYENFLVHDAKKLKGSSRTSKPASVHRENFVGSPRYHEDFINRSGIVHRLDKETSGILLVAKNPSAFEDLQKQFKERRVKKVYIALVHGKVTPSDGEIRIPVGRLPWNRERFGIVAGGREAVTKYKVIRHLEMRSGKWDFEFLKSLPADATHQALQAGRNQEIKKSNSRISHFSLLEIYPETGRTHQIRVHLKHIGHPVFSDLLYAGRKTARQDRKILPRFFLHAAKIAFSHPITQKTISFESPFPSELKELLAKLE